MSGLDVAAAAAQLLAVITKVVPFLADTPHTDNSIRALKQDLEAFQEVTRSVEKTFGFHRKRPLPSEDLRRLKNHLNACRTLVQELKDELPDIPAEDRNPVAQFGTQMMQLIQSGRISRMCNNITEMKQTLQTWVLIVAIQEGRQFDKRREHDQALTARRLEELSVTIHKLRAREVEMTKAESIVQQNAKECLDKAESVYQVFSAPGSSRSSISAPFNSVFSQRHYPAEPGSEGPSAGGSATPVDSLSVDDELEYLTDKAYADIINDCVCDVRRYRLSKDLDSAAVALYEAINYSQKRKRHHNTEFHNERDMKMTLADMHMDRQYYSAASEIFKELLEEEQHRSQNAWVLNCRLAKAYLEDLRLDLAVSHVHQANTIRLKTSSKRDPLIIETLNLLQQIHSANNQPREALLFEREALQHRLSELDTLDPHLAHLITDGGDPRDVLRFLHNLGEDAPEHDAIALKTFHHSVALNRLDIAKELFDAFPVIRKNTDLANELGVRPVMCAVQWGHENMVEWLLETENCNVNARTTHDSSQNTALMVAAGRLDLSIVMMLLAHGANPMDRDCHGRTALNHALAVPSLDNSTHSLTQVAVVSTILSAGKPEELLREKCTALKTALHEAVEAGNASIVALLVEKGADLEARDVSGRTPLLAAIDAGKPDAVNALLTAGADWQTKDDLGRTTISAARKPVGGSKKMLMMLKNKRKETPRAVPHASTHGNGDDMRRMTPSVSSATSERNSQERRPSTQSTRKSITSTGPPLAAPPNRRLSIFTEGGENVLDRQSVLVRTSSRVDSAAEISIEDEIRNSLRRGRCKSGKAASVLSTTSTATKWGSKLGTLMRDFERRG